MWPRLLADSMLGNIAKKLRIFGFDTLYPKDADDKTILTMASSNERIVLTKDKQLYNNLIKKNLSCILLHSESEVDNFVIILNYLNIKSIKPIPNENTRCNLCNEILNPISKASVTGKVPEKVFDSIELFFECNRCSKVYWAGKHIIDINHLIEQINDVLYQSR
ncbi:MAG: Mut7-C RNAse domain-containing protein [Thermoproteota archaeon]|nr:Mut7-C RNAse domain-containing protein [Thermoproteota archaeon]